MTSAASIADAFAAHRRWLWGLAYRLLGSPADADDVVQETFARAVEHRPAERDGLRPWLTQVATRVALDRLRRRRRRRDAAPWLPGPVPDPLESSAAPTPPPEARYSLMESASLAFLVAMEALTPHQRAVLVLRDVLDLSGAETAAALDSSPGAVRVALYRARQKMADYDADPIALDADARRVAEGLLLRFMTAARAGDVAAVQALLTDDAVALSDGGGRYFAARRPITGPNRIARVYVKLARRASPTAQPRIMWLNGLPALVITDPRPARGQPPLSATQLVVRGGRIAGILAVLADDRLTAVARAVHGGEAVNPGAAQPT